MASSGKTKTTMAKLQREANLRERRMAKASRKRIRKETSHSPELFASSDAEATDETLPTGEGLPTPDDVDAEPEGVPAQ